MDSAHAEWMFIKVALATYSQTPSVHPFVEDIIQSPALCQPLDEVQGRCREPDDPGL